MFDSVDWVSWLDQNMKHFKQTFKVLENLVHTETNARAQNPWFFTVSLL